jgi:predicted ATPase
MSRRMYGDEDAIGHLTRALTLLESMPHNAGRDELEIALLACLGPSLIVTAGYAAPEVGEVYGRARMLCQRGAGREHFLAVLWGLWVFNVVRGELQKAREAASRMLDSDDSRKDPLLVAGAQFTLGSTLFHLGELAESRLCLEQAWEYCRTRKDGMHLTFGPELGVFCLAYLGHVVWMLGEPGKASDHSRAALARADELAHPFSIVLALAYDAMLRQLRGDAQGTNEQADKAAALCEEHGYKYYLAWTPVLRGWSMADRGMAEEGVALIEKGLVALGNLRAGLRAPYYRMLAAQAWAKAGRPDTASRYLSEALALGERGGESWCDAEIHRTRAEILSRSGDVRAAEADCEQALSIARRQSARMFELRAALALARMSAGRKPARRVFAALREAHDKLGGQYDARELGEARALLEEARRPKAG